MVKIKTTLCDVLVQWGGAMGWCNGVVQWGGAMEWCNGVEQWRGAMEWNHSEEPHNTILVDDSATR